MTALDEIGTISLAQSADGMLIVGQADQRILVSLDLLCSVDKRWVYARSDYIMFVGINRTVEYEVTGWDPAARGLICERVP